MGNFARLLCGGVSVVKSCIVIGCEGRLRVCKTLPGEYNYVSALACRRWLGVAGSVVFQTDQ